MSTFTQLNSKTWIQSKTNLDQYKERLNADSILGGPKKKDVRPIRLLKNNEKEYKKIIKQIFENRTIVSEREFNKVLKDRFGASTWYRKRMIDLNLISSKNKIIKPAKEVIEN